MVQKSLHKQGIGTFLLRKRIQAILLANPNAHVIIDTSQHSQSFFAQFGFQVIATRENYYAPGLHRVDMELDFRTDGCRRLLGEA
ncbi:MAG: GNAT family N-acetyltransferase [Chloroflexi bacterium]|nr:GNAT family N-acetyltransferase [Chloroflexota bacterium]